ncbi:hypothetical protein LT493_13285 [Streptomyces tricolor]|nr:hypothetical protein [Streptomyces tricolor]
MIHEVDEGLRRLLGESGLEASGVEVVFDAPTRDWAARRSAPDGLRLPVRHPRGRRPARQRRGGGVRRGRAARGAAHPAPAGTS